ncbi:MAG: DUF4825 domain-containing protein [Moraxella sp.]|nr:DUF4825 domain-containing protein [Moraxella sp.]
MAKYPLIMMALLCLVMTGCTDKPAHNNQNIEQHNANVQPRNEQELYHYKTAFVGDNSKVSAIVHLQSYPKDLKIKHIEIESAQSPYGLKVFFESNQDISHEALFKNAVMTFALIENVDILYYINEQNKTVVLEYRRKGTDERLQTMGDSLQKIGSSADLFNQYLQEP